MNLNKYLLCTFCNTIRTSFKCVLSDLVVSNVCTNKIEKDCAGYDENFKKVGVCNNWQRQISVSKCLAESPGKVQAALFTNSQRTKTNHFWP